STETERHQAYAGEIAAGVGKTLDETRVDGIATESENHGAGRLGAVHGIHIATEHDNNFWIGRQHLARKTLGVLGRAIREEHAEREILIFDPSRVAHPGPKRRKERRSRV